MENSIKEHLNKYYMKPKEVQRDVENLIAKYGDGVRPEISKLVLKNGTEIKELICLVGNLTIPYKIPCNSGYTLKSAWYNLPIRIWLLETYPIRAPLVYVKPVTSDMRFLATGVANNDGKVKIRYLTEWSLDLKKEMLNVSSDSELPLMLWNLVKMLESIFSVRLNKFVNIMHSDEDDDDETVVRLASIISLFSRMYSDDNYLALEEKAIRHQRMVKVQLILILCLLFALFILYK